MRRLAPLLALMLLFALSVTRFDSPNYTLEPTYTDHMRHEYAAWAFVHMGFDVFRVPLEDWSVHAEHVHTEWGPLPEVYPPGLVLLFVPFGVASNEGIVGDAHVHLLLVMLLGAAAVAASFQLWRTLRRRYEPSLAVVLTALGAVMCVTWGLNGFVDPLAAGLALAGIYWVDRGSPGRALLALSAALSLQFRLWYLWPVVLVLAVRRWREIPRWQLVVSAVLVAASLVAFVLAVPSLSKFSDIPEFQPNALAISGGVGIEQAIALCLAGALLGLVYSLERRLTVVATLGLALVLVFGVDQWQAWYPILFLPLLAVMRSRYAQAAVTVAFLELTFYLGGFPNVLRSVHLYVDAIR